jgi:hypothetical protein
MTTQNDIGIVYILTNEAIPGMIKIGKTAGNVKDRMNSLYKTGVPLPFECHYAKKFDNHSEIEKNMHDIFSDKRVNKNREFFEVEPERVVDALRYIPGEIIRMDDSDDMDKDDKIAVDKSKNKLIRSKININNILNIGDIIYFSRDENITATVLKNNKIDLNGEVTSLSKSAAELLKAPSPVQGTIYWMYDGETLNERRNRMENNL